MIEKGLRVITDFPLKQRRKQNIVLYDKDGNRACLVGTEADALWSKISPTIDFENIKEVRGMVARKGKVTGRVRVVMDPHGIFEFNGGDILVTGMTRPDYLSLMKKAAAFVTDEGGITCHAAIVARELDKPCIIGTRFATKVFKSGDMVEVDAERGIVMIIPSDRQSNI